MLSNKGCKKLTMQVGLGKCIPNTTKCDIKIESFSLKASISQDIVDADLVISHAGAGSCLAVLNANKPLIVIVNNDLMDNHQEELADKLLEEGFVFKSNCDLLCHTLNNCDTRTLKTFVPGNSKLYAKHIDNILGFSN